MHKCRETTHTTEVWFTSLLFSQCPPSLGIAPCRTWTGYTCIWSYAARHNTKLYGI